MDPTHKPRADARLKTLTDDRQAQIAEFALGHTLAETVDWLGEAGTETSISAVSQFLSWYRLKQQLARNESAILTLLTDIASQDPAFSPDRLFEVGQSFFAATAIEKQDARAWHFAQNIAIRRAHLQLASSKHREEVQARRAATQRKNDDPDTPGGLSPETVEKIERELNLL